MPGYHANVISIYDDEQVVEDEVEVVQRLTAWVDQLASIRSADPFVGLPVDEQSPVGPVISMRWERLLPTGLTGWQGGRGGEDGPLPRAAVGDQGELAGGVLGGQP